MKVIKVTQIQDESDRDVAEDHPAGGQTLDGRLLQDLLDDLLVPQAGH